MTISLNQILCICLVICLIIGAFFYFVFRIRKGEYNRTKEIQNKRPIYRKPGVFLLVLAVFGIFIFTSGYRSARWEYIPMTEDDKARIATNELRLSELSDYMDRQYRQSFRDTSYLYDTAWFDSVDLLFTVLQYSNDNQRTEAMKNLQNYKVETQRFDSLEGGKMEVYQIPEQELPIQNSKPRDMNCRYSYYVIMDPYYNNRVKIICVKMIL